MRRLVLLMIFFPAVAWGASQVTVPYDESGRPLGTCLADRSETCSSSSTCGGEDNYCVHAPKFSNPSQACFAKGADCSGDVTFKFDKDHTTGTFVDGQPWVLADSSGKVRITGVTPNHTSGCESGGSGTCLHGIGIDMEAGVNSLDSRKLFDKETPRWPHTIDVGDGVPSCVLKAVSVDLDGSGGGPSDFLHAAMLTVVKTAPPANAFRPNCMGERKLGYAPYYTTADVDLSRVPNLTGSPPGGGPTLADVEVFWTVSPHLGYQDRNSTIGSHMTINQSSIQLGRTSWDPSASIGSNYHAARANRTNAAYLRMAFSDFTPVTKASHARVVYHAIQHGLDKIGAAYSYGDHPEFTSKRTKNFAVPMMFAAQMVDDLSLLSAITWTRFVEMDTIIQSPKPGVGALWGNGGCGEADHWNQVLGKLRGAKSAKECKWQGDPYGYVDQLYDSYQLCCSSGPWESGALAAHFYGLRTAAQTLGIQKWLDYQDRFSAVGFKADGDLCARPPSSVISSSCSASSCPGYGVTWGPAPGNSSNCDDTGSCQCIPHNGNPSTDGRNPAIHGRKDAWWTFPWNVSMWNQYRECAAPAKDDGSASSSYPCDGLNESAGGEPVVRPNPPILLQ